MHDACHPMSRGSSFFLLPAFWLLFSTKNRSGSLGCSFGWRRRAPLDPSKKPIKTNTCSTFPLFGPTNARAYMHHTCHLMSRGPLLSLFLVFKSLFLPKPSSSTSFLHQPKQPVVQSMKRQLQASRPPRLESSLGHLGANLEPT